MRPLHKFDRVRSCSVGVASPRITRVVDEKTGIIVRKFADPCVSDFPDVKDVNDIKRLIDLKIPLKEVKTLMSEIPSFDPMAERTNNNDNESEE